MNGATRWLSPRKAAVMLSLRHKSDDQLWFSFFHEACHVLEHRTSTVFIDAAGVADGDEAEQRANQFARDILIPPDEYGKFVMLGQPSFAEIVQFAKRIGISPGIVVGRLQFEGVLPHTHGNKLKRRFRWDFE